MPRGRPRKIKDPADQLAEELTPDQAPKPRGVNKPRVSEAMAAGVVQAVESLSLLVGHTPDQEEAEAATKGLLAAAKKSLFVAKILAGSNSVSDYGSIVVGIGGLFARIGSDIAVAKGVLPEDNRQSVYITTKMGYNLLGAMNVETRRTRGPNRKDGVGQDMVESEDDGVSEARSDVSNETGLHILAAMENDQHNQGD